MSETPPNDSPDAETSAAETAVVAPATIDDLHRWIETAAAAEFVGWFEAVDNADATRLLAQLTDDDRERLLAMLDPETARWVVEYLPESQAVSAIGELEPRTAARILEAEYSSALSDTFRICRCRMTTWSASVRTRSLRRSCAVRAAATRSFAA